MSKTTRKLPNKNEQGLGSGLPIHETALFGRIQQLLGGKGKHP